MPAHPWSCAGRLAGAKLWHMDPTRRVRAHRCGFCFGVAMIACNFVLQSLEACQQCRVRRVKCTGDRPCANCVRRSETCVFEKLVSKKRGVSPVSRCHCCNAVGGGS